jgi:hypothetical protein
VIRVDRSEGDAPRRQPYPITRPEPSTGPDHRPELVESPSPRRDVAEHDELGMAEPTCQADGVDPVEVERVVALDRLAGPAGAGDLGVEGEQVVISVSSFAHDAHADHDAEGV